MFGRRRLDDNVVGVGGWSVASAGWTGAKLNWGVVLIAVGFVLRVLGVRGKTRGWAGGKSRFLVIARRVWGGRW